MKLFLSLFLLTLTLFASNPTIFATLGDTIYDNAPKIEQLKKFHEYQPFLEKIDNYVKEVNATKKLGFAVENGTRKDASRIYLQKLRELAKTNDFFVRSANVIFEKALANKNYDLLMDMLDTGLIDVERNKERLLEFYNANKDSFEPRGTLGRIVEEEELRKKSKNTKEYYERLKKLREQEKIRRLRERDKKRQEELQKKLEKELEKKKEQIQKEQIQELKQEDLK